MDAHIRAIRKTELTGESPLFNDSNADSVLDWLVAAEGRRPVVLVGSGFSRNAVKTDGGDYVDADDVPLWSDLARRMAETLGPAAKHHDPLILAELYQEAFGDVRFRQFFEQLLSDDDLAPGKAHKALAGYDYEAVITTNLLDTLLDKALRENAIDRAEIIKVDQDLSAYVDHEDGGHRKELIYFHGHRSQPDTWVLTRTQYEEHARLRPVMHARVRQLLAQRPLLIVGYSLADPDFHDIYRQVSADMARYQPLGLAILMEPPLQAEVAHWRRLGIRIVTPFKPHASRSSREWDEFFGQLFRGLRTSWRARSDSLMRYINEDVGLAERVRRFTDLAGSLLPVGHISGAAKQEVFSCWSETFLARLSEKEREDARDRAKRYSEDYEATREAGRRHMTVGRSPVQARARSKDLPLPNALAALSDTCPDVLCEALFHRVDMACSYQSDRDDLLRLCRLAFARGFFGRGPFQLDTQGAPWIAVAVWLAQQQDPDSFSTEKFVQDCRVHVARYRDEAQGRMISGILQDESELAEVSIPANQGVEGKALRNLLDGKFVLSADQYSDLAGPPGAARDAFVEWVHINGLRVALQACLWPRFDRGGVQNGEDVTLRDRLQIAKDRANQLEGTIEIREWRGSSEHRLHELEKENLSQATKASPRTIQGGRSARANAVRRELAELEGEGAPPQMTQRHVKALLDSNFLDDSKALSYRICFDEKGTVAWLKSLSDQRLESIEAQRTRDQGLVGAFLKQCEKNTTKTDRVGQLCAIRGFGSMVTQADAVRITKIIQEILGKLGCKVTTWSCLHSDLSRDYADAAAAVLPCLDVVEGIKLLKIVPASERRRAWSKAPCRQWLAVEPARASELAELLRGDIPQRSPYRAAEVGSNVFELLRATQEQAKECTETIVKVAGEWCESSGELGEEKGKHLYLAHATYLVEGAQEGFTEKLARKWISRVGELGSTDSEREQRDTIWLVIANLFELGTIEGQGPRADILKDGWEATMVGEERWRGINEFLNNNPHYSNPCAQFLWLCAQHLEGDLRSVAAKRLFEVVKCDPHHLELLGAICTPQHWGDEWPEVCGHIQSMMDDWGPATAGMEQDHFGFRTREARQVAVIALWSSWSGALAKGSKAGLGAAESELLDELWHFSRRALGSERAVLANHAAYAIVDVARVASDEREVERLNLALVRISKDHRVPVRMAAAYAAGCLPRVAKDDLVKEAARALVAGAETDPNARIQSQLAEGRLRQS